ncbi:hypothetical protein EDC04DRAFT_2661543 [Pisolithus marmoratus]|nr:hypothetical protein EDC04DRAFT_2661543 [Pisolithus marmoratus]
MEPEWFVQRLKSHTRDHSPGIVRQVTPANLIKSTVLAVRSRALIRELSTCSVTSGGLQISLPIVPYPGSPGSPSLFRATLGCVASLVGPLMTIDLSSDSTSTRYYRFFGATEQPTTFPRVKPLFLSYYQDESRNLTLDDRTVSFYGFTRCGTFPSNIVRDSVKLLLTTDLIVVIYANDKAYAHDKAYGNSKVYGNDKAAVRFAVGFGYYLGSAWTHVAYDENRDTEWQEYARKAYDSMRDRQRDLVGNMPDHDVATYTGSDTASFTRHAHLPRSIWAARIMWGVWYRGNCKVTIDIVLCSGCCHGPLACETSTVGILSSLPSWSLKFPCHCRLIGKALKLQDLCKRPDLLLPSMVYIWMGFECNFFTFLISR